MTVNQPWQRQATEKGRLPSTLQQNATARSQAAAFASGGRFLTSCNLHSWAHAPAADDGWGFAALLSFAEDKDVLQRQRFDSAHGDQTDGFHLFVELRHGHFVDLFDGDGGIFLPVFNERHPAIGFQ